MFFQNVWVHFGLPTSIISYRDFRFLSEFWSTLWGLMDKIEEEHNISSTNRWENKGGEENSGAPTSRLLHQTS